MNDVIWDLLNATSSKSSLEAKWEKIDFNTLFTG